MIAAECMPLPRGRLVGRLLSSLIALTPCVVMAADGDELTQLNAKAPAVPEESERTESATTPEQARVNGDAEQAGEPVEDVSLAAATVPAPRAEAPVPPAAETAAVGSVPTDASAVAPHAAAPGAAGPIDEEPIVEVVDLGVSSSSDASTELMSNEPEGQVRTTTVGFALLRPEFTLDRGRWGPEWARLPSSRGRSLAQLFVQSSAVADQFEIAASGVLTYRLLYYGSTCEGCEVRSEVLPDLRELYAGFFSNRVSLRVGQQRIAWGIMEIVSPNDVANAQDLTDPALGEQELRALPTPLVRLDATGDDVALQLVAGLFVPDRFDLFGTPWSVLQSSAPIPVRAYAKAVQTGSDSSMYGEVNALVRQTSRPIVSPEQGVYGARFSWRAGSTDVQHYYQYGFDSTPAFLPTDAFVQVLFETDWETESLASVQARYAEVSSSPPFSAEFVRRHHVGTDVTTLVGPLVLRVDAAYQTRRVLYESSLRSYVTPAVRVASSIEYQTGALDEILIVEGFVQHLVDKPLNELISYSRTTWGAGTVFEWPLFAPLSFRLRSLLTFRPWSWTVRPELLFTRDGGIELGLGALVLDGDQFSLGGYYEDNSALYARLRQAF